MLSMLPIKTPSTNNVQDKFNKWFESQTIEQLIDNFVSSILIKSPLYTHTLMESWISNVTNTRQCNSFCDTIVYVFLLFMMSPVRFEMGHDCIRLFTSTSIGQFKKLSHVLHPNVATITTITDNNNNNNNDIKQQQQQQKNNTFNNIFTNNKPFQRNDNQKILFNTININNACQTEHIVSVLNSFHSHLTIPVNILNKDSLLLLKFIIDKKNINIHKQRRQQQQKQHHRRHHSSIDPLNPLLRWSVLRDGFQSHSHVVNDDIVSKLTLTKHAILLLLRLSDQMVLENKRGINSEQMYLNAKVAFSRIYQLMKPISDYQTIKWLENINKSLQQDETTLKSLLFSHNKKLFKLLSCSISSSTTINMEEKGTRMDISGELIKQHQCCPFCHHNCLLKNQKGYLPAQCIL